MSAEYCLFPAKMKLGHFTQLTKTNKSSNATRSRVPSSYADDNNQLNWNPYCSPLTWKSLRFSLLSSQIKRLHLNAEFGFARCTFGRRGREKKDQWRGEMRVSGGASDSCAPLIMIRQRQNKHLHFVCKQTEQRNPHSFNQMFLQIGALASTGTNLREANYGCHHQLFTIWIHLNLLLIILQHFVPDSVLTDPESINVLLMKVKSLK